MARTAATAFVSVILLASAWMLAGPEGDAQPKPKPKPAPEVMALAKDSNQFGLDLYHQLAKKEGNLFFSPSSIYPAFGMLYAGARGQTADEMTKTLHLSLPQDKLNPAFSRMMALLNPKADAAERDEKRSYQLAIANALWAQQDFPFNPQYLDTTGKFFNARLTAVDFKAAAEAARQQINTWVEKQTNDKIKDLIPKGGVGPLTRLVLTNAIYFKGNWADQFDPKNTRDEPFKTGGGEVTAPMMHRTGHYGYLKGEGFAAVEMPCAGDELAMQVFLPDKVDGLAEFEHKLTVENLGKWTFRRREVQLSLPKFKMTYDVSLSNVLQEMGMKQVFTQQADLSGIGGSPGQLFVTGVFHKAFVDVNEEGTEAAAATGIVVGTTSVPPPPAVFKADHPFVFTIRHKPTGSVLFIGRVIDPTK